MAETSPLPPPFVPLQALQCSPGYEGNLCSGCSSGYGRTGTAACSACPNAIVNAIYYILASLINIIMIIITVR